MFTLVYVTRIIVTYFFLTGNSLVIIKAVITEKKIWKCSRNNFNDVAD